jgi:predicted transcriptional regulator
MTITAKLTTVDRDNRISNDIGFSLGQLAVATNRQMVILATQSIDQAMTALERAQAELAHNETE